MRPRYRDRDRARLPRVPSRVQQIPHGRVGPVPRAAAPGIAEGSEGRAVAQEERAELAVPLLGGLGGTDVTPGGTRGPPSPPRDSDRGTPPCPPPTW